MVLDLKKIKIKIFSNTINLKALLKNKMDDILLFPIEIYRLELKGIQAVLTTSL